jgi:hypothetical protein
LLQKVASDLRPDVSIDKTVKRANPLPIDWNILFLNLRHLDIRSAWRRTHSLLGRPKGSNNQSEHDQAKNSADQEIAFLDVGHVVSPILARASECELYVLPLQFEYTRDGAGYRSSIAQTVCEATAAQSINDMDASSHQRSYRIYNVWGD